MWNGVGNGWSGGNGGEEMVQKWKGICTAQGWFDVYISAMDEFMEECLEWMNFWHKGLISVVNGLWLKCMLIYR